MEYQEFLQNKKFTIQNMGMEITQSQINPLLFPFQKDIVKWAVKKGRCAIFLDTGLGKTFIQLEWARIIGNKTLIFAPLSVARQTIREGKKIDIDVHYVRDEQEMTDGINITNYEMVDNFTGEVDSVVLDECFPPDTPIEVFSIDKSLELRYIKDIMPGDIIINAQGDDYVKSTYKRKINRAVRIATPTRTITSSENHPFFTVHGWRSAQDLQSGDFIMESATAMRLVRDGIFPNTWGTEMAKVLREILLSEMENEHAGTQGEGSYKGNTCTDWKEKKCMVSGGKSNSYKGIGTNHESEPNAKPGNESESVCYIAEDEAQTFRAWGKWTPDDITSAINEGCSFRKLDCRIGYITGATSTRFSDMLQSRLRKSRLENSDRSRRIMPSQPETTRSEERRYAGFVRVDSVEILEQGHPELEKYRDAEGNIYFYDIKAARHPSFSVNGILVHNSSILKSISGKIKRKLIDTFRGVPYKLCCTATPAPNDYTELGNHAEFLNVCSMQEMLSMFFINANKEHTFIYENTTIIKKGTNKGGTEWRIKHHAEDAFFRWLSKWAILMTMPSDIGYADDGYVLPELTINPIFIDSEFKSSKHLFFMGLSGLDDRVKVRSDSVDAKLGVLSKLINNENNIDNNNRPRPHNGGNQRDSLCKLQPGDREVSEQSAIAQKSSELSRFVIWCGLDKEQHACEKYLKENGISFSSIFGSLSPEEKEKRLYDFIDGDVRILLTKPRISGYGLNLQSANNMIFFGINDSWETFYQAIRREWRFGQKKPVNVHVVLSELEREVYDNVQRKDKQSKRLKSKMIELLKDYEKNEIDGIELEKDEYKEDTIEKINWKAMKGDSCIRMKEIKDESVDLSVYSPPFADLFVYSNSDHDLGNCRNWDEFFKHYTFIVQEMLRITKLGRLSCVHTSDIPAMANRDGYIGLKDFPGRVIQLHQEMGWVFTGRAFIQKNPQAQAIRTKCKSLLFVQMKKDSSHSRPALIDQILIFKKPGENMKPIEPVKNGELDNNKWISWAHGIWTDINETDTLQYYCARDTDDEKHICPLQLGTIERCVKLYSNPNETVFTPFMGIGSEAFMAVKLGRKAIGIELKESYYNIAVNNLNSIQQSLF